MGSAWKNFFASFAGWWIALLSFTIVLRWWQPSLRTVVRAIAWLLGM